MLVFAPINKKHSLPLPIILISNNHLKPLNPIPSLPSPNNNLLTIMNEKSMFIFLIKSCHLLILPIRSKLIAESEDFGGVDDF